MFCFLQQRHCLILHQLMKKKLPTYYLNELSKAIANDIRSENIIKTSTVYIEYIEYIDKNLVSSLVSQYLERQLPVHLNNNGITLSRNENSDYIIELDIRVNNRSHGIGTVIF